MHLYALLFISFSLFPSLSTVHICRYKGKLIVRFDDTNPAKEKDEYCQAIINDLASLGVVADRVTHTSDSFDIMQRYAEQLIVDGHGYMDDTPQEQMQVGEVLTALGLSMCCLVPDECSSLLSCCPAVLIFPPCSLLLLLP